MQQFCDEMCRSETCVCPSPDACKKLLLMKRRSDERAAHMAAPAPLVAERSIDRGDGKNGVSSRSTQLQLCPVLLEHVEIGQRYDFDERSQKCLFSLSAALPKKYEMKNRRRFRERRDDAIVYGIIMQIKKRNYSQASRSRPRTPCSGRIILCVVPGFGSIYYHSED